MLYLSGAAPLFPLPPEHEIAGLPLARWAGDAVVWKKVRTPQPVYLSNFVVPQVDASGVLLFGLRHELSDAIVGGRSYDSGYILEYVAAWSEPDSKWSYRRMLQQRDPVYSDRPDGSAYVSADEVADPKKWSIGQPPRWKAADANWPVSGGFPMSFVGQLRLPKTKLTQKHLTWNTTVFLFTAMEDGRRSFRVVTQETRYQSASDHYRDEDR